MALLRSRLGGAHDFGSREDGLDDVVVARATAKIPFHLFTHHLLRQWTRIGLDEVDRRHDHSRRAEAALQGMAAMKGFLHRMQRSIITCQALDGDNVATVCLRRQHGAGFNGSAIEMDDAATALRGIAADMGPSETEMLAQEHSEKRLVVHLTRYLRSVDGQANQHRWNAPRFVAGGLHSRFWSVS